MKQIAIISGKGGTGKTTLTGSLEFLFENLLMADCDVDASNLHLLFEPVLKNSHHYIGGKKANIDGDLCTGCGKCQPACRFDAIFETDSGIFSVDQYACEGCNACTFSCPVDAISLSAGPAGHFFEAEVKDNPLIYARLNPGEENSGGLVAEVRRKAVDVAKETNKEIILIDGVPGIGCPATSSIVGVSYVIVVTEPSQSGFHDLKRVIDTIDQYKLPFGIVINKWNLNPEFTNEIIQFCTNNHYDFLGKIPFDSTVMAAVMEGKPVILYEESSAAKAIREVFIQTIKHMKRSQN